MFKRRLLLFKKKSYFQLEIDKILQSTQKPGTVLLVILQILGIPFAVSDL